MKFTVFWLVAIAIAMCLFFLLMTDSFVVKEKAKEKPLYGQVTAKEWIPAYANTWLMPMQSGDITIMIPMSDYVPDAYLLKVAGRIVAVNKEVFQKTNIGDMYGTPPVPE